MEPRSGLRYRTRGSVQPPIDHRLHNLAEAESSDEDDDDIPATKLPSVSPAKPRFSSTNAVTNHKKRSYSDAARGGIVLYPGSKKQRNGYNMVPLSRAFLPFSTSDFLSTTATIAQASGSSASSGSGPEDDVPEGLLNTVNDAIRPRQAAEAQDYTEQPSQQPGVSASHLVNHAHLGEPGGRGTSIDIRDSDLPLAIPAGGLASSALPLNADGVNDLNEKPCQGTSGGSILAATSKKETRIETEVQPQVLLPVADIWELPISPRQLNVQKENPDDGNDRRPPTKRRGRPPKLPVVSNITRSSRASVAQKRKQDPRLCNTTDKDYRTRITELQKDPIPGVAEPGAQLPWQPPLEPNATSPIQLVAASQFEQINSGDDACTRPNKSQLFPTLDIQPKVEAEEEEDWDANHAILGVRDGGLDDDGDGDFELDDNQTQSEPIGRSDDECSGSNVEDDEEMLSDFIDGFDTDPGSGSVIGEVTEEDFEHDVDAFNAGQTRDAGDEDFEGPVDDDVLAIHLDHRPLRQLCILLSGTAWAGVKGDWQWRKFDYDDAETEPARALLPVLAKLERLYQATPKAPNLKEQNTFLREHANMLRYYFHKIKIVVDHICTQRLEVPEENEAARNMNPRKRKRMTQDLVLYVVPMLVHVLASAWGLGGKTWLRTSFTTAAVKLLERALSWIKVLHPRLLGELTRCSFEESPQTKRRQQAWRRRNARREEIGPLLDDLCRVIAAAPDQFGETEARRALVAERKKRSLLSIHGIHYGLGSSTPSSRASPSVVARSAEWSIEEQRLLFLRIQASFPVCPDLNDLRWELNKTVAQTVAMTEEILGKMLARVLTGYSPEEQAEQLRQIMRGSGVAGLEPTST